VKSAYFTHRGAVRSENQDAVFAVNTVGAGDMDSYNVADLDGYPSCIAVIDGMGGYEGGALAARIGAKTFEEAVRSEFFGQKFDPVADEAALEELLRRSSDRMAAEAVKNPSISEIGATMAGIIVREHGATAFNCGDCRAYRISRGEIERLTKDHSVVQSLFESGMITEDEMRTHPRKNVVTSAVTANNAKKPELFVRAVSRVASDEYFICSDGVWEAVTAEALRHILRGPYPDSSATLRDALMKAKCRDNISFIWAKSLP
jgi:protein phosphatase